MFLNPNVLFSWQNLAHNLVVVYPVFSLAFLGNQSCKIWNFNLFYLWAVSNKMTTTAAFQWNRATRVRIRARVRLKYSLTFAVDTGIRGAKTATDIIDIFFTEKRIINFSFHFFCLSAYKLYSLHKLFWTLTLNQSFWSPLLHQHQTLLLCQFALWKDESFCKII